MNSALRRRIARDRAVMRLIAIFTGTVVLVTYAVAIPFLLLAVGSTSP